MLELRQSIGISFMDLEVNVFKHLQAMFIKVMQNALESIDDRVFELRDKSRYRVKDSRKATVTTLFGDVTFRRRYYIDRETARYKCLLDETLEFGGGSRISPALSVVAAIQAVTGPSYRAARDNLERFYGHRVLSHEGIRQIILEVGKMAEADVKARCEKQDGIPKKKVPVLFLESDGWWVPMQQGKRSNREVKMLLSHEGWDKRSPGSNEYLLKEKTYYQDLDNGSDEFWDMSSRYLYSKYDIGEDTVVVLNGDRAPWIKKGLEYFPNAMYQVDRFHVKRDLKGLLKHDRKALRTGFNAFDKSDIEGLTKALKLAMKSAPDVELKIKIAEFLGAVERIPECFRDYRVRLLEKGYEVPGLRGLGSAESNVDKFSDRTRKRGQSWGKEGLKAMLYSMIENFEGKLEVYAEKITQSRQCFSKEELEVKVTEVAEKVTSDAPRVKHGAVPIKNTGTTRSGGLSQLFRQLDYADLLIE